jgi:hypothetical protein
MTTWTKNQIAWRLLAIPASAVVFSILYPENLVQVAIHTFLFALYILALLRFRRFAPLFSGLWVFTNLTVTNFFGNDITLERIVTNLLVATVLGTTLWVYLRKGNIALLIPVGLLLLSVLFFIWVFIR